jgi:hypothetical protein
MQARSARSAAAYDASVAQLRTYFDLLMSQAQSERASRSPGV